MCLIMIPYSVVNDASFFMSCIYIKMPRFTDLPPDLLADIFKRSNQFGGLDHVGSLSAVSKSIHPGLHSLVGDRIHNRGRGKGTKNNPMFDAMLKRVRKDDALLSAENKAIERAEGSSIMRARLFDEGDPMYMHWRKMHGGAHMKKNKAKFNWSANKLAKRIGSTNRAGPPAKKRTFRDVVKTAKKRVDDSKR